MHGPDQTFLTTYLSDLQLLLSANAPLNEDLRRIRDMWLSTRAGGGKVYIVGNGGSAAIAAHIAIDASKNARVPAVSFGDGATITCLANDYGFENWIVHALREQARPGDCLVAISSSGRSKNILNAVTEARQLGMGVVTLSGMSEDNELRGTGDVNLFCDSRSYNHVETVHQVWLMAVVDLIIGKAEYPSS